MTDFIFQISLFLFMQHLPVSSNLPIHFINECSLDGAYYAYEDEDETETGDKSHNNTTSKSKSKSPAKKDDKTRLLTLDELCADNKAIKFEA